MLYIAIIYFEIICGKFLMSQAVYFFNSTNKSGNRNIESRIILSE